jgi:UDP-2,3-diacylglucosamine pyrophosphatase LpxH
MDALVMSDWHLGSRMCLAPRLLAVLNRLLNGSLKAKRLVVAGDLIDSPDLRNLDPKQQAVLTRLRLLAHIMEVVVLEGNHDPKDWLAAVLGLPVQFDYVFWSGNRRILVEHGHRYDLFVTDHPWIVWGADLAYAALQVLDPTHRLAILAKRWAKRYIHAIDRVATGSAKRAEDEAHDVAVCGHTHFAEHRKLGWIDYHNAGCWTELPGTCLTVHDGTVTAHTFESLMAQAAIA